MHCRIDRRQIDRRQFLAALGIAPLAVPAAAWAQGQAGRLRRVGVMMAVSENDTEGAQRLEAFRRGLAEAGWAEGRATEIETRWYRGNSELAVASAKDLLDRGMEVILVNGTPGLEALRKLDAKRPIVFTVVSNPVGAGYVPNLSRPGGNITGFSTFEPDMAGKWLQLLQQIAPGRKHVAMLLDPRFTAFNALWQAVAEIAPRYGITPHAVHTNNPDDFEAALNKVAALEAPGLILSPSPAYTVNRKRLVPMINERRVPAIYPFLFYVPDGGLVAYGFNATDQFKRAAGYVARILKGENAGDLPVQAPSLFELGVNLRTARAMGITVPQTLLVGADEIVQ